MSYKYLILLWFVIYSAVTVSAQNCNRTLKGRVLDSHDKTPLEFVSIYIKETATSFTTDSVGSFLIDQLCAKGYHISFSYIGYENRDMFISTVSDSTITVLLDQGCHVLGEVEVTASNENEGLQNSQNINAQYLNQNSNQNLSELLQHISGVSSIKSGGDIGIPVVQGMYGNRLMIMNNGIAQAGQQWGLDHSPEIDPGIAKYIKVIKGVAALQYQGSSLGNVILIDPGSIGIEPHFHAKINYSYATNGRSNNFHTELKNVTHGIGWKVIATLKKGGDKRTSDYYLTNTGNRMENIAVQLEKSISKKWKNQLFFSTFHSKNGILRGSHIGNISDLQEALHRDVPFFTASEFSYDIDRPFQDVRHTLTKVTTKYYFTDNNKLEFNYAYQKNIRKEFDIRRSNDNTNPALSLSLDSHFAELQYEGELNSKATIHTGVQFNNILNTNIPETDILPLIPNYASQQLGFFGIYKANFDHWNYEMGTRLEFIDLKVATISQSLPRIIEHFQNTFLNKSLSLGISRDVVNSWNTTLNIGFTQRQPAVNELYSNGLHQGVSGIEIGNSTLNPEASMKTSLTLSGKLIEKLKLETTVYLQRINNYIYLYPDSEVRLTIRGAFPVFRYGQTNASIAGWDVDLKYAPHYRWLLNFQSSLLKGKDITHQTRLIYMPSNNGKLTLQHIVPKMGKIKNMTFQLSENWVFRQKSSELVQDFLPPPSGYSLLGASISGDLHLKSVKCTFYLNAENLLNTKYRDYLNRMRYFADDTGLNVVIGALIGI
ncbi:MAG: carboxypeptidase-like regulatory domain-containing protein [Saprospiraceae bacterium]|nr:carboxypeptidase-like regulatory domain-containing protein [Saprospiraceae bacterium]MCB9310852.1 carboxypeptidase-like regulatory domain-containing protein [Lewinellaceae bacterium]